MVLMLPVDTIQKVEKYLLLKRRQLEEQLKTLEARDPVVSESVIVPSEIGTDAWEADVHATAVVSKSHLLDYYHNITHALFKLHHGTYGICDKCGKVIDPKRLAVIPVTSYCLLCA
ncbi:TraR/DksA C4-type zinc finger protein [Candidatus Daviesbacteria bacterium]|nr:TraR/DksA C4-type zinc finger protein [Candidatus Daviesbacteria bacterium]